MQTNKLLAKSVSLLLALGLVAAGCGDDSGTDEGSSDKTTTTAADDAKGDGALAGMKGTTPLVDLGQEFKDRMLKVDPDLSDFNYGAESYDAAIVIALAATEAKTDGIEYASKINGITRGGEKCTDFAGCKKLIDEGKDVDYDGASGPLEFSGNGEPTEASYGVLQFGSMKNSEDGTKCEKSDECIDESKTEFARR